MSPLVRQPLTVEHGLLGFLHERPMHGYEIYLRMVDASGLGLVWQVKQSHLYAMLDKLEGDGFIAGRQEAQDMRPPRRVFRLTSAGRKAFRDWLGRPVPHGREIRLEFMAKLFFARREGPEWVGQLIDHQRQECVEWRANLLAQARATPGRGSYEWLVYQFRVGQVESMIAWLDLCLEAKPEPGAASNQDAV